MNNRLPTTTPLSPLTKQNKQDWRKQTYLYGLIGGTLFGLLCAYFYARTAEDDAAKKGFSEPNRVQTGDVIGLALAALAILRQVAELGRTPDKKPNRR